VQLLILLLAAASLGAPVSPAAHAKKHVASAAACARIHPLWKAQLRTLQANRGKVPVDAWVEQVYRPYSAFWAGYLGDEAAFRRWARGFTLAGDPRRSLPAHEDIGADIVNVSHKAAALAGRPVPCSDWYVLFGPGWTNMGGMGDLGMVVDFMGMPKEGALEDFHIYLPHEINHLMWSAARPRAGPGPLAERMVNEGFATYFATVYGNLTDARSLGYTPAEYRWALGHEAKLWTDARALLESDDKDVINRYMAASSRPEPDAPGKVGYFLGYRIVEAYVARHGPGSWKDLYGMTARQILDASRYDPS
jgi:hypothetical protein